MQKILAKKSKDNKTPNNTMNKGEWFVYKGGDIDWLTEAEVEV